MSIKANAFRAFCLTLATALAYSATALAVNPILTEAASQTGRLLQRPLPAFTERPTPPNLGDKPGRDPRTRGGLWSERALQDRQTVQLRRVAEAPLDPALLLAATIPSLSPLLIGQVQPGGDPGGPGLPGEGGGPGGGTPGGSGVGPNTGSQLNTNTGNRHVSYPLVSWSARGQNGVAFTLYHNSRGSYQFDLGKGWSHSYDVRVDHTPGSTAIVRYGDGTEIPYTQTGSVLFTAPAGIHDTLTRPTSNTWRVTTLKGWRYDFNSQGKLTTVTDRNGNTVNITRSSTDQRISHVSDNTGRQLSFTTNSIGLVTAVSDPAGRTWNFAYNALNQLTAITYPANSGQPNIRSFTYSSGDNIASETDRRGQTWSYTYTTNDNLASFTNPLGRTWTWAYTTSAATMTQPGGATVVHNYANGLLASQVDQAGFSESYTYNANRDITRYTDKRGQHWDFTYNTKGSVLTATNPLGQTTTYTYNSSQDLLTTTTPLGHTTTYTYSPTGNLLTVTDPLGRLQATITYNSFGEPTSATDALGRQTTYGYNVRGDVNQVTQPGNIVTSATYDILGRPTSVTDPATALYTLVYDSWGRVTSITEPGNATSSITYDPEGNVLAATDPLGRTGSRVYDALGRLTAATNAKNETETYTYNDLSDLVAVTNARGFTRTYQHTPRGEVTRLTLPDGAVEQWAYNGNGDTTAYTNPLGQTIFYIFDTAGRQTAVDYPSPNIDTTFTYDASGRLTQMSDLSGNSAWTYDAANQILSLTTPQGAITYAYNLAGQATSMTDASGTTSATFDGAGRPSTVTDAFGDTTSVNYDSAGRVSSKNYANGLRDTFTYDARSRLTALHTRDSANNIVKHRSYTYDLASQITQAVQGTVTTTYTYDPIGQLLTEAKSNGYQATYTYDANGNRLTRTVNGLTENYNYDGADKLLTITGGNDPRTFQYDAAGRTTAILRASGTTTFTYDIESRVTSIMRPGMVTNTFAYNGLDTRISLTDSQGTRTFRRNGVTVTDPVLTDGAATYTPTGEVRAGQKRTFHAGLKSNDLQTSPTGSTLAQKQYDAFGNTLATTGNPTSPFHHAGPYGYQSHPDHNLQLLGHRHYDPSTGRFLTRDPIKDGRNWYTYCGNSPINHTDPAGLRRGRLIIYLVKLLPDTTIKRIKPVSEKQAVKARAQGNDVEVVGRSGRQTAKNIEKKSGHPDDKIRHSHKHPSNQRNKEPVSHYQKGSGHRGHTFYGRSSGLALPPSTNKMLNDYNNSIEEAVVKDFGLWEEVPILGDVITGFKLLGDWIRGLGQSSRKSRAMAFEEALSTGME